MPGVNDYIKEYGDVSFESLPFNDADNFTLCSVFYAPIENVVPAEFKSEPMTLGDAALDFYASNGYKHKAVGLILPASISRQLVGLAEYDRFASIKITGCESVLDPTTDTQFCAATFILPDGTLFVLYRGTDDTFAGWKEDFDILTRGDIPSYKLAVDYLERVASLYDGKIMVSGHSKGGNVSLYAALSCSESTRRRITRVYNNEGPGFSDYSLFSTDEYRQILPNYRHFVPQSSFIGMLLAHDDDFTVVKSSHLLGPVQHDITSWQLNGSQPVTLPELSTLGKVHKLAMERLLDNLTGEQVRVFADLVATCVDATGQSGLLPFAKHLVSSNVKIAVKAHGLSPEAKHDFKLTVDYIKRVFIQSYSDVKKKLPAARTIQVVKS